jgi:hypothetical protein
MKTRAEVMTMVKGWKPTESADDIDAALHERHKAYGAGSGDSLLAWSVDCVASAVRHYLEAVHEDRLASENVLGCVGLGGRLRGNLRGFGGPRFSTAAMWHEKIADAQDTLARVLDTYALLDPAR